MGVIGLTVVTYKDNFGSALQTYATQYAIRKLGYDTKVFDMSGIRRSIQMRKICYYFSRLLSKDEREYVIRNALSKKANWVEESYSKNMRIRHEEYRKFYSNKLSFFPRASSWKQLSEQSKECEAVVVGSDQLWGAANVAAKYFTLEFVPDTIKKIAYSTSFGTSVLPRQLHAHVKNFINRIDHVSVRETAGQNIIKEITNRDVSVVCDPTMLLTAEEWMEIQDEKPFAEGDYILCYLMGDNPEQRTFIKRLKEQTNYRIIGLLHGSTYISSDESFADESPYNVGPGEFINLIRNAKYMCTDSFHGCVFSILSNTPFFAFRRERDSSKFSTNSRLYTLLSWTGLNDRIITGDEDVGECSLMDIDWASVNEKVNENRKASFAYLENALSD
ncbi:polysaccharide pyruvyl transferase family protein [Heliophilum fasciatum]|uniref:Polysaccharide pyruvyl transferase n=1 Tax=Heliophilum fasciatum TaxID=35700 RepID=A0A4R2RV44_9FIRM|nr:polysaccharide pyruvyl transferase family protein [Heliophilum fasciatum]MCW2277103.1 hypothetical protein [Heliophilum fasciatum]TCP68260.1 polysaccharide pyruvyl transferase [Heliophilum fasciatum]